MFLCWDRYVNYSSHQSAYDECNLDKPTMHDKKNLHFCWTASCARAVSALASSNYEIRDHDNAYKRCVFMYVRISRYNDLLCRCKCCKWTVCSLRVNLRGAVNFYRWNVSVRLTCYILLIVIVCWPCNRMEKVDRRTWVTELQDDRLGRGHWSFDMTLKHSMNL